MVLFMEIRIQRKHVQEKVCIKKSEEIGSSCTPKQDRVYSERGVYLDDVVGDLLVQLERRSVGAEHVVTRRLKISLGPKVLHVGGKVLA